jgi:hypothetical protein
MPGDFIALIEGESTLPTALALDANIQGPGSFVMVEQGAPTLPVALALDANLDEAGHWIAWLGEANPAIPDAGPSIMLGQWTRQQNGVVTINLDTYDRVGLKRIEHRIYKTSDSPPAYTQENVSGNNVARTFYGYVVGTANTLQIDVRVYDTADHVVTASRTIQGEGSGGAAPNPPTISYDADAKRLNWTSIMGADFYKVFRDDVDKGTVVTPFYDIPAAWAPATYNVYVKAIGAGGTSGASNTLSITINPPSAPATPNPPIPPRDFIGTPRDVWPPVPVDPSGGVAKFGIPLRDGVGNAPDVGFAVANRMKDTTTEVPRQPAPVRSPL